MKKKLILIDGNSLLYRAFFAMRYLSTAAGQPTNAVYGLATMLLKVLEEKPEYIAVAFDTAKPTFRHVEYEQYKAHRKAPADELIAQFPIARELIRAFNIPVIEVEGFEADDVIGALAVEATREDLETVIVTGDLDALQLVNDSVRVMTTVKGVSDTVVYGPDEVVERFGFGPEQMIDYKGLKGDPSDNIPGVPGIGEKTAADLLKRFGGIENLLEHVSELPEGRLKKSLEENADIARLSKRLATIVTYLPVKIDIHQLRAQQPDYDTLRDLLVRLEFKTMIKRLPEVDRAAGRETTPRVKQSLGACRRIGSAEDLKKLVASLRKAGRFALQCHTANEKSIRAEIIGLSFCVGPDDTAYVEVIDPTRESAMDLVLMMEGAYQANLSEFTQLLGSPALEKYCHDSKLATAALALRGVDLVNVTFDTMLAAYLLDATRSSFDIRTVAFEHLALDLPGVTDNSGEETSTQVCGESEAIFRLKPALETQLQDLGLLGLLSDVELPLAPILAEMELIGVSVDVDQLGALSVTMEEEIRTLEGKICEQAGEVFNIGSPKQLQTVLFEKLGIATSKKTKTGFSTSAAVLDELADEYPIVADILRYRELTKMKSTYADSLPKLINPRTGRIHTSLNQAVTATGRLSSSDPNLQNIPVRSELGRQIRKAFIASGDKVLLSADYSQIELRILAHVTGDENLTRAFENDEDIHNATACTLFNRAPSEVTSEERRRAKTINFAVIYGMADYTLSKQLGIGVREAKEYINTYFTKFPGVLVYTQQTLEKARELGYVTTLLGRRRYMPDINSGNRNFRLIAERAAVNMPIQGTAADVIKLAMIRVQRALADSGLQSAMLLQVHDELVFEVPPKELAAASKLVKDAMEHAYHMRVPIKVDVKFGKNWSEMEEGKVES